MVLKSTLVGISIHSCLSPINPGLLISKFCCSCFCKFISYICVLCKCVYTLQNNYVVCKQKLKVVVVGVKPLNLLKFKYQIWFGLSSVLFKRVGYRHVQLFCLSVRLVPLLTPDLSPVHLELDLWPWMTVVNRRVWWVFSVYTEFFQH